VGAVAHDLGFFVGQMKQCRPEPGRKRFRYPWHEVDLVAVFDVVDDCLRDLARQHLHESDVLGPEPARQNLSCRSVERRVGGEHLICDDFRDNGTRRAVAAGRLPEPAGMEDGGWHIAELPG
jgi:hypothetical protein